MSVTDSPPTDSDSQESINLPWDFSQWFDRQQLLRWVEEESRRLDWSNDKLNDYLKQHPEFRPRLMLDLLTISYATGRFGTAEIVASCQTDPFLSKLCGNKPPSEEDVFRFRRWNRGLLKWSLLQLFKKVFRHRFNLGTQLLPFGLMSHLEDAATMRLDIARHVDLGDSGF